MSLVGEGIYNNADLDQALGSFYLVGLPLIGLLSIGARILA